MKKIKMQTYILMMISGAALNVYAENKNYIYNIDVNNAKIVDNYGNEAEPDKPKEPLDPEFWTILNKNLKGMYISSVGVSGGVDSLCMDLNLGQSQFKGDSRGYLPLEPNFSTKGVKCYGETQYIYKLPSSGKYYFEMTYSMYSSGYQAFAFKTTTTYAWDFLLSDNFGTDYRYLYSYTWSGNWLKSTTGGFKPNDTYQFFVNLDDNKLLFRKIGYESESYYAYPKK